MSEARHVLVIGMGSLADQAQARVAARGKIVHRLDAATAMALADGVAHPPDVVVVETACLAPPEALDLAAISGMAPVVLLGTDPDAILVLDALIAGVRGHVDWPHEAPERLDAVIDAVRDGHYALSPRLTGIVMDELLRDAPGGPAALHPRRHEHATPRQAGLGPDWAGPTARAP